jgi:hypothetical protein
MRRSGAWIATAPDACLNRRIASQALPADRDLRANRQCPQLSAKGRILDKYAFDGFEFVTSRSQRNNVFHIILVHVDKLNRTRDFQNLALVKAVSGFIVVVVRFIKLCGAHTDDRSRLRVLDLRRGLGQFVFSELLFAISLQLPAFSNSSPIVS